MPGSSNLVVQANLSSPCVAPAAAGGIVPEIITWTFCYTESQSIGDVAGYGPFTVSYVGQLTTLNTTAVSPVSNQAGYLLTSARGYRLQLNNAGVLTRNEIIGLGWVVGSSTERGYDPYLYTNGATPSKTVVTPATLSAAGLLFALDNAPILPNGYQSASSITAAVYEVSPQLHSSARSTLSPLFSSSSSTSRSLSPRSLCAVQAWLVLSSGVVVEAFETLYNSTGGLLSANQPYPTQSSLSILTVTTAEYAVPLAALPSCPLNFTVFPPLAARNTVPPVSYQVCGQALSSATSPAAPWSEAVGAVVTVAPFPTYSAVTGQWSFQVQSVSAGGYSQQLQTANSSAALVANPTASGALYLSNTGTFSLDTAGLSLVLASSVSLPSSSSTAHASSALSLAGSVPASSPLLSGNLTLFGQLASPWTARLTPGLSFLRKPLTYVAADGSSATAPPATSLLLYGGQDSNDDLFNDIWLSTDSGNSFSIIAGPGSSNAQQSSSLPLIGYDGSIKLEDSTGRLYAIAGSTGSVVQYSDNGINWLNVTAPFPGRSNPLSMPDPFGNVYVMGGQGSSGYLNDVWLTSTTNVSIWQQQSAAAPWDIRDSILGAAYYSSQLRKTVLLLTGGHDDTSLNFRPNEGSSKAPHSNAAARSSEQSVRVLTVSYSLSLSSCVWL